MPSLKCLIVDDEPLALDVLETYIERLDYLTLSGKCKNAIEAFNFLQKQKIDLLFLDIQMPQLTGIDFLRSLLNPPKVILTTAFREYALDGYELNVLDYLLKPIPFDRFLLAVNKAIPKETESLPMFLNPFKQNPLDAFIYIKADKKMVKIFLKDILYIESLKDYVRIKTKQKEVVAYQTISFLEEKLPDHQFVRIHKGFIVSLGNISAFTPIHVEVDGKSIPIGRMYKNEALKRLGLESI